MTMEQALMEICLRLRREGRLSQKELDLILREQSRHSKDSAHRLSKRRMMAFYLRQREDGTPLWESLGLSPEEDEALVRLLRTKPRRTASGVATVSIITKPWPCAHDCLYCPNDVRMPKSYLSDEPACQRAERCSFDPYLQVASRLTTLGSMGHNTDKVEIIILGGTWLDYPKEYRLWFICQVFRALDDFGSEGLSAEVARRRRLLEQAANRPLADGQSAHEAYLSAVSALQGEVDQKDLTYDEAFLKLSSLRCALEPDMKDSFSWEELFALHAANEEARARCVGLVVETRPDTVSRETLTEMRAMGATKLQIGIQSLDDDILEANARGSSVEEVAQAMRLMRLFGFKSHVHLMANLLGADAQSDLRQYHRLMEDGRFKPDEVKLYPCALVESAHLTTAFQSGKWQPYAEGELIGLLSACVLATPPFTRISRMIRDIPSDDILVGNKKTNLRQMVEQDVVERARAAAVQEMRMREVATGEVDAERLRMEDVVYETDVSVEHFLQWVDTAGRLAGFLRLSLPLEGVMDDALPVKAGEAMIREVHVYGRTSRLHESSEGNQHIGLGRQLVERACQIAHEAGYRAVNVISAVGTRGYYRNLGFQDRGLYQQRGLG